MNQIRCREHQIEGQRAPAPGNRGRAGRGNPQQGGEVAVSIRSPKHRAARSVNARGPGDVPVLRPADVQEHDHPHRERTS